jgi:hypothetical protein
MMCYKLSCMCDCGQEHKECRIAGLHTLAEIELLKVKGVSYEQYRTNRAR